MLSLSRREGCPTGAREIRRSCREAGTLSSGRSLVGTIRSVCLGCGEHEVFDVQPASKARLLAIRVLIGVHDIRRRVMLQLADGGEVETMDFIAKGLLLGTCCLTNIQTNKEQDTQSRLSSTTACRHGHVTVEPCGLAQLRPVRGVVLQAEIGDGRASSCHLQLEWTRQCS